MEAKIVGKIDDEGRLPEYKTEGTKYNPYREAILDDVCERAFGSKHPAKEGVCFFAWNDCGTHVRPRHSGESRLRDIIECGST